MMLIQPPLLYSLIYEKFPHQWEKDYREPLFTFENPWYNATSGGLNENIHDQNQYYGFFFPSMEFVFELVVLLSLQSSISSLIAILVYKLIIEKQGAMSSYLIGYGFFIPFFICFPSVVISKFDITNKVFRFCIGTVAPILSTLKTTEAMHGIRNEFVAFSIKRYIIYFSIGLEAKYDKKTLRYKKYSSLYEGYLDSIQHFILFYVNFLSMGIYVSMQFLFPNHLPQFNILHQYTNEEWFHWKNVFDWKQLLTTIYYAAYMELGLKALSHGFTFLACSTLWIQFENSMNNPLLKSSSITDFWGKRWNLVMHNALQRGVYKPIRKHSSKYIAMLFTFIISALVHEWTIYVVFSSYNKNNDNATTINTQQQSEQHQQYNEVASSSSWNSRPDGHYEPIFGASSIFFLWQAVLMCLQFLIGKWAIFQNIPFPINVILIIWLGGCMGHFFTEPYVRTDYFIHSTFFLPIVKPLPSSL